MKTSLSASLYEETSPSPIDVAQRYIKPHMVEAWVRLKLPTLNYSGAIMVWCYLEDIYEPEGFVIRNSSLHEAKSLAEIYPNCIFFFAELTTI